MRYSCEYFTFSTLGYSNNYSFRDLRIECISDYQECPQIEEIEQTPSIKRTGITSGSEFREDGGMAIRYIREKSSGNSSNTRHYINEIQAYNSVGANIALHKNITGADGASTGDKSGVNTVATDGTINNSYLGTTTNTWFVLDLGFVEQINEITVWNYWADGRTYNNIVTEVSADGIRWFPVF